MELDQTDIFISYRREGGEHLAARVREALLNRGYSVFMDVEDLKSGKFTEALLNKINIASDFILILTPGCLNRCNNGDDWLRIEIAHAIQNKKNIVPIIARGFEMPKKSDLPSEIAELVEYNGLTPAHELFKASIERLSSEFLISERSNKPTIEKATQIPEKRKALSNKLDSIDTKHNSSEPISPIEDIKTTISDDYLSCYNQALSHYNNHNYEEAQSFFGRAIYHRYNDPNAYFSRSLCHYCLGNFDRAINDLQKADDLGYQKNDLYNQMGLVYYKMKEIEKAITILSELIQINSKHAAAFYMRGLCYKDLEKFDHATDDFLSSLEIRPNDLETIGSLAQLYPNGKLSKDETINMWHLALRLETREEFIDHINTNLRKLETT